MKRYIVLIAVTLVMKPIFPQQIFIEPEIGYYDPLEWTRFNIPDSGQGNSREIDFNFDGFPRFGANLGINFSGNYQMYVGYKLWLLDQPMTTLNTFVFGWRGSSYLLNSNMGIRLGIEYLKSSLDYESNSIGESLWLLNMKGTGYSLEVGIVYKLFKRGTVFIGFDYLTNDVILDKLTANDKIYTLTDLGLDKKDATINMNGFNIKIGISFLLTNPLEFED